LSPLPEAPKDFVPTKEQQDAYDWIEKTSPYGTPKGIMTHLKWLFGQDDNIPATTDDFKTRRALQQVTDNLPVTDEYRGTLKQGQTNFNPITHK
jgi:hypothetical protein